MTQQLRNCGEKGKLAVNWSHLCSLWAWWAWWSSGTLQTLKCSDRQGFSLIYGMDDACMVGCTVWMEEVPLVQVDRLALAFQYLRGNPSKMQKKNKQKQNRDVFLCSRNFVFAKITEDFPDECVAGSCHKGGLKGGLLNFMGGGTED